MVNKAEKGEFRGIGGARKTTFSPNRQKNREIGYPLAEIQPMDWTVIG